MNTQNARHYFEITTEISSITFGIVFITDFVSLPILIQTLLIVVSLLALITGCIIFGFIALNNGASPVVLGFLVFTTWVGLLLTLISHMILLK